MHRPSPSRIALFASLLLAAGVPPAGALLNLDGTRNQIFVFGSLAYSHSSNIFAETEGSGDYTITAQVGAELQRRAGIITVDSTAKVDFVRYGRFRDEDTINPNFSLTLSKATGRTTGSLDVRAYRETRSDSAVNLRTSSWNFPATLEVKYPINEKFHVTSKTGYVRRTYSDAQSLALVDYTDFNEGVDLYYVYTSKLDLLGGYRIRAGRTSRDTRTTDHWFSLGASGGLLAKLSGSLRFGYQIRDIRGPAGDQFSHFNAAGTLNWPVTRKLLLDLSLNRDFNTIATGASVDSESASLHAGYSYSRKIDLSTTASVGKNNFLDSNDRGRHDTFFSWDLALRYRMNDHLQTGATYSYIQNWSSVDRADYDNHGISVDISARY